jgi:hypothetical protein
MVNAPQIHNSAPETKAELRLRLVDALGGPASCRVLETHSGPGEMHRLVYNGVHDWLGIDADLESPNAIHHDNREVMRAIDLSRFNLLDVDAFGSPWEQLWLFAQRRSIAKGEKIGLALTSGLQGSQCARSPTLRAAGWSTQMQAVVGANFETSSRFFCGDKYAPRLASRLIVSWFKPSAVERFWACRSSHWGGGVWYFGAVLLGA